MKFTSNAKAFSDAVTAVSRVVENRNTYPILANVLIKAEADRVSLRATDLDIEISLSFEAAVENGGQTTVPARTLSDILRKMDKGAEVLFEVTDDAHAIVKSGRSRFSLATLSPDSFPDLKQGNFARNFDMPAADLRKIIAKTSFAISTEETRYYLNGIYLHAPDVKPPVLRGVATDGHRMARCGVALPDGAAGLTGIIIPRKTVTELAKLIEKVETVGVAISDSKILVTVGNVSLLSKLIEGTFPDYERVTPKNNNKHAIVSKSELDKALDRVSTLASDKGGKAVKLSLKDGLLGLEVTNPDHGTATEEIAVQFDPGETFEIGFNGSYLANCLDVLAGKETRFEFGDAGSPTILRSADADDDTLLVLMPMRV